MVLLGAALGGADASASISFQRTDVTLPGAPDSVALGNLDGQHGDDIVLALPGLGSVGVMLNAGDGTFAPMQQYSAGPNCMGSAVDITLGDVTQPTGNRLLPDGKLDAYVSCAPYVVRLTGDGAGALGNPESFNLGVQQPLGSDTLDMLALMRRPDGNPAPLLVLQHAVGQFGRQLCVSYELDPAGLVCSDTPVQGPLAVGDLNGTAPGVPPDEVVTSETGDKMGIFGWSKQPLLTWGDSTRTVPGDPMGSPGLESATVGDVDNDGDLDVLVGKPVNSLSDRVESIHYFEWGATGLEQVARALPSVPGLDAVAIADVDRDGCNDVVGAGDYGRGMVHLGQGGGAFDGGHDLPQIGYQDPATATRATLAVGDLTGDGAPEVVIADAVDHVVMVYRNASTPAGAACFDTPPTAAGDAAVVAQDAAPTAIDVLANDSDPDGGAKVVASVTQPAHGTSSIGGGGVTYQPSAGYCNDVGGAPADTFQYTLNGGSTATVAVTVQCAADPAPPGAGPPAPPGADPLPPPPVPADPRDCEHPGTVAFLVGTAGADVLVGTSGRDVLSGRGGDDCLYGRAGDDRLSGGTGDDVLSGSSGSDRMNGDAGGDRLSAGTGNDTITPGAGKDQVTAGGGNDKISARDGSRDTIDCGAGHDTVTADRTDTVKSNCEKVSRK